MPQQVTIPKTAKNPLANIFPGLRSRIGVKIKKEDNCCSCGLCETNCPVGAIRNGRIHSQCIRCLRCVTNCPQKALQYKNGRILDIYLKSYCKEEYVLYLQKTILGFVALFDRWSFNECNALTVSVALYQILQHIPIKAMENDTFSMAFILCWKRTRTHLNGVWMSVARCGWTQRNLYFCPKGQKCKSSPVTGTIIPTLI